MNKKLTFTSHLAIGFMLFALFFGAGNLIFPAQLGQEAGSNVWPAVFGFLTTGVTLPFIGILAIGFSGSNNLQELASRVHPMYGVLFTAILYLSIGPFFAAPRTATVAYEVGITPFIQHSNDQIGLFVFSIIFFLIALYFSLRPGKIVESIGKILAPLLVTLLVILLVIAFINPMGAFQDATGTYVHQAYVTGFLEGYHTMDALASLVFGIIIITIIRSHGVTSKWKIFIEAGKSGIIATFLLAFIYVGIALLGASSVESIGMQETGGAVLSGTANYYFGIFGNTMLAIVMMLACLTTAIGLIIANAEYFQTLFPRFSYKQFVYFFTILTFGFANFGLANIITYSVPVLMVLYPLAIGIMMLSFLSPLFMHKQFVYIGSVILIFAVSLFDGCKALAESLGVESFTWTKSFVSFYEKVLPLYGEGLGWFAPAFLFILLMIIFFQIKRLFEKRVSAS